MGQRLAKGEKPVSGQLFSYLHFVRAGRQLKPSSPLKLYVSHLAGVGSAFGLAGGEWWAGLSPEPYVSVWNADPQPELSFCGQPGSGDMGRSSGVNAQALITPRPASLPAVFSVRSPLAVRSDLVQRGHIVSWWPFKKKRKKKKKKTTSLLDLPYVLWKYTRSTFS